MGIQFEKVKKNNFSSNRPIPVKQGRVRGNKNIFKVGLSGCFVTIAVYKIEHQFHDFYVKRRICIPRHIQLTFWNL